MENINKIVKEDLNKVMFKSIKISRDQDIDFVLNHFKDLGKMLDSVDNLLLYIKLGNESEEMVKLDQDDYIKKYKDIYNRFTILKNPEDYSEIICTRIQISKNQKNYHQENMYRCIH